MVAETRHDERAHWDAVYAERSDTDLSWYQDEPAVSLRLIEELVPDRGSAILDAGAGRSRLTERLTDLEYHNVTVVDLSETALAELRVHLGDRRVGVRFIIADIRELALPSQVDLWHDRAVFHFLITPEDRAKYVARLEECLRPGGYLILATFALDGPPACSGLPVCRYDAIGLGNVLGPSFSLVRAERESHSTPWGAFQPFTYAVFRRL